MPPSSLPTEGNGLIQVAAAFHHQSRENVVGCRSLLEKGSRKLARFGAGHMGVDLARFLAELQRWREFLEQSAPASPPPWPRINAGRAVASPLTRPDEMGAKPSGSRSKAPERRSQSAIP